MAEQSDASKALDATKGSLRRTAATESADAYNTGRTKTVHQLGRRQLVGVGTLSGACLVCAAEEGEIVGIHERFSIGEPGSVHPYCRCSSTSMTMEMLRNG